MLVDFKAAQNANVGFIFADYGYGEKKNSSKNNLQTKRYFKIYDMINNKSILITGGTGSFGRNLTSFLLKTINQKNNYF